MEESSERTCSVISGGMNNKMNSDSGYGSHSNKSNSQSQRSTGSSKSHQSSISSGSCNFPNNPTTRAPTPCGELILRPPQASTSATMCKTRSEKDYKRKKKLKVKSASSTVLGENNQRLPATGVEASGASESSASVGNRSLSGGQPSPDGIPHIDTKTLQIVALTHTLSCTKKFRDKNLDIDDDSEEEKSSESRWSEYVDSMKDELSIASENFFGAVVSMDDGLLIHITEELTHLLGYPKGMWMGRNFIDLVHPKDKVAFASQFTFTGGIEFPTGEFCMGQKEPTRSPESFFCRLRQYRGLKTTGFGVVDKTVIFFPFRLTLKLKELEGLNSTKPKSAKPSQLEENAENDVTKSVYLFIGANRISSAYQYPEEVIANPDKFTTRHSATCHFGDIDSVAVKYLGHLPQDVVGHSVLDYYHPDDMVLLKDIYEGVMAEHGKPFKSKPYRFRVFNGTFAMLETDWSCFINPWSWKLEFVIGQHKVLKGPLNPNVFMPPKAEHTLAAHSSAMHVDEAVGETKIVQDQIKQVLGETVTRRMSEDPLKQRSSRRKKDLAVLLEVLLEQIGSAEETSDRSDSVESEGFSVLERDSAMLGEISPHHDDRSMSNQSSETPPSYNQLNYRENIERFFLSHPKTTRESDEFIDAVKSDGADVPSGSADEESKESRIGSSDCVNRQSGSNSGDNSESSEPMNEEASGCKSCSLTEDVLYRHNENMEKSMAQKHRESRGRNNSLESSSHKNSRFRHPEAVLNNRRGAKNNLKRTGNLAGWASAGSSTKAHKQPHMDPQRNFINQTKQLQQERATPLVNLWPPYSVAITPAVATATYTNTFDTPVTMPRIGIPGYQYLPTVPTVANPQILTERPQQNSFVCYPNQLRQYVPQAVPYTIPGAVLPGASIPGPTSLMYHSLTTPSVYRPPQQQLFGQSVAQQQIMIGPGGSSMLPRAPILHPAGPMIPRIPPAVQSLGIGPGVGIGSGGIGGVGTPIPIRPFSAVSHGNIMNPNLMTMSAGPRLPATSLSAMIPDCSVSNSNPTSTSSYPSLCTSTAPSVSISSSSGVSSTPPIITPKITTSSTSSGEYHIPIKSKANITHIAPIAVGSSSSSSPELSKINKDKITASNKRIVNLGFSKESLPDYNFSSSDTFGSSSSCSLYSLLKRNIYSDETSTSGSGKAKDFAEFPTFQSNSDADGDQDMIWENHAEKKVKEQGILKSGHRFNGKGKAKLSKPPWLKNVDITREFNFQYEIQTGNLAEILKKDLESLKLMENHTSLVDEQLGQLYKELELEGLASKLNLEEGSSAYSSSSNGGSEDEGDGGTDPGKVIFDERQRETHLDFSNKRPIITPSDYDKIVQMFEENSPLPREELLNFSN